MATTSTTVPSSGDSSPFGDSAFRITFDTDSWNTKTSMPWLYFHIRLPSRPLPPVSQRHFTTPRLLLRSRPETQNHSTSRGRPDCDRAESEQFLSRLAADDEVHWYFVTFLRETGELVGEGGIPDLVDMGRAGWPEAEFLLKKEFWRQGYGSVFWEALIGAWWDLPRELQRHHLFPAIVLGKEPGDEVEEIIGFVYEDGNQAARGFFNKMLQGSRLKESGSLSTFNTRNGREGTIINWTGRVSENLRARAPNPT
ncbi:hypothetical protein BX600DRAFT_443318 [Xylariales sp. PMI_506]|nr:hypothetical protein BX600DRAFT_443318 [Xylariales sp. PMI_506]